MNGDGGGEITHINNLPEGGRPGVIIIRAVRHHRGLANRIGIAADWEGAAVEHFIKGPLQAHWVVKTDPVDVSPFPVGFFIPKLLSQPFDRLFQAFGDHNFSAPRLTGPPGSG